MNATATAPATDAAAAAEARKLHRRDYIRVYMRAYRAAQPPPTQEVRAQRAQKYAAWRAKNLDRAREITRTSMARMRAQRAAARSTLPA